MTPRVLGGARKYFFRKKVAKEYFGETQQGLTQRLPHLCFVQVSFLKFLQISYVFHQKGHFSSNQLCFHHVVQVRIQSRVSPCGKVREFS